jgi:HK97 family phage prohead protease
MDTPRYDLLRAQISDPPRATEDGNTLVGYAAVFNEWTTIDSWEGRFLERVAPGAFKRSLDHRGAPKVLFNHGMDPSIGDKPLGRATAVEDDHGLLLTVPLSDTTYNRDLKALIADGALDGMSFRFSVPKGGDRWDDSPKRSASNPDGLPERTLVEVNVPEAGPVTFPAYEATQVGIRSAAAYVSWLSTPPDLRAALLRGDLPDLSDLAHEGTPEHSSTPESSASAPPDGTPAGERARVLRQLSLKEH